MVSDKICNKCNKPWRAECYWLKWDLEANRGKESKIACLDCWNKNQEEYKKEYDYITYYKGTMDHGLMANIWSKCKETGCNKGFSLDSTESLRHNPYSGHRDKLSFDEHQELNKNPNPVNSIEELLQQWMNSMEYQKIYYKNNEIKIVKKDGEEREIWLVGNTKNSLWGKIVEYLKTQPNAEVVRKNNPNPNPNGPNNPNNPNSPNNPTPNSNSLTLLNQINAYFSANSIHSIIRQPNGDLLIKFTNNNPSQTINEANDNNMDQEQKEMWKKFKEWMKKENQTTLDKQKLEQAIQKEQQKEKDNTEKPRNWTPWIIGGGVLAVVGVIIGIILVKGKKKSKIRD